MRAERYTSAAATWRTAYNGSVLRAPAIYPEGFLPLENSISIDQSLVTGLRGEAAGWRWDLSLNYGSNNFKLDLDQTVNQDLGATSPTHFYAGELKNTQSVANLDIAREFPVAGLRGPLTVALGAESRHERYAIGAGGPNSYYLSGSQGVSGFRPINAGAHTRHNESLYLNLEAQVSEQFSAALAGRHERYSDFGSTTSAKASARYAVSEAVSLRGTASSGFRAPSLAQQYYTITTTNFSLINGVWLPSNRRAAASVLTNSLQAALRSNKARNASSSLGRAIQPKVECHGILTKIHWRKRCPPPLL